jgi:hypothetical protein
VDFLTSEPFSIRFNNLGRLLIAQGPRLLAQVWTHCSITPLGTVGTGVKPLTIAQAEHVARMLRASLEMRTILARIAAENPIYHDPDEGPLCVHCCAEEGHTPDCSWKAAQAVLRTIDNPGA